MPRRIAFEGKEVQEKRKDGGRQSVPELISKILEGKENG